MLGYNQYFFNNSIKKYITIMGSLFSGMVVDRSTSEKERYQRVPISFQEKERFIAKLHSPESLNPTDTSDPNRKARVATIVPAMSLQLDGMSYNADKKTSTANRRLQVNSATPSMMQMNPVPYRFNFSLSIYTRNLSDQFALIEQILPFFQPSFTCVITELLNQKIEINRNVLINLDDISFANEFVGDVKETRYLQTDLSFSLDGYLYPPQTEENVIETVFLDFYANQTKLGEDTVDTLEGVDWHGNTENLSADSVVTQQTKIGDEGRQ